MKYTLKQIETEEEFIQVFGRNPRFSMSPVQSPSDWQIDNRELQQEPKSGIKHWLKSLLQRGRDTPSHRTPPQKPVESRNEEE